MSQLNPPTVSVVMSVYNGERELWRTMDSVLSQRDCEFEFIVIDDGSTDSSGSLLDEYARRDQRVRVVHQENTGLTRALMRGCAMARGEFIARQDCGDLSLPGRLAHQLAFLQANQSVVLTCCATRIVAPYGEILWELDRDGARLESGLQSNTIDTLISVTHHGATMFRKHDYNVAGGYRLPFVVAQDLDLWLRLVDLGRCFGTTFMGYEAGLAPNGISSQRRTEQVALAELALDLRAIRRTGQSEEPLLSRQRTRAPTSNATCSKRKRSAEFYYFVGSCLSKRDRVAARKYLSMAVAADPFSLKARFRKLFV
jgi:glycosyltransferase involved in cell wall biosynthesis